ncbi:MAG: dihydrodipicolinate synthase family protein [Chloroflexi bacterium]|nr:dihydrodipicolinate synthase family protein [Chloroflexota bacterium]
MSLNLSGVFPPIPTSFDADGKLLLDKMKSNIEKWNTTPIHGYVVLGSNGEYVMLNEAEKCEVWETARAAIPREKLFFAGAGAESTQATRALVQHAARIGADAVMIVTPHYYKPQMNSAALVNHFRVIADASTLPVLIYNIPAYAGIDMDAATIIQLAEHPNIVGVKDSSGNVNKFAEVIRAVRPDFAVLAGSGGYFYPALCVGAVGVVAALANVAPRACVEIFEAFHAGNHARAKELQLEFIALNAAVTSRWSVPGLKAALDLLDDYYGGPPRLPLRALGDEERKALRKIMQDAGVL